MIQTESTMGSGTLLQHRGVLGNHVIQVHTCGDDRVLVFQLGWVLDNPSTSHSGSPVTVKVA